MKQELIFNGIILPFEPCPTTPNCHIDYMDIRVGTDKGLDMVKQTLKSMGVRKITVGDWRVDAEFRVFFFIDDVKIVVEQIDQGCRVWIRSSSRVGESDLGVNKRRVHKFFNKLRLLS